MRKEGMRKRKKREERRKGRRKKDIGHPEEHQTVAS